MSASLIIAGLATGLLLGILGSGGSIVTLPALLYLLDVAPKPAIAMSLGIVAITASITAIQHGLQGHVNLKITAIFGLFGIIGTYAGARLGLITPVVIQLGIFALIMYIAAWEMLKPKHKSVGATYTDCPAGDCERIRYGHIAIHGIVVGILTGLIGVGGGFLIVPALVLLSGLSMKQAVGTSLSIIALKSFAGFAGYATVIEIDYSLLGTFAGIAIIGSLIGGLIGQRLPDVLLKRGFGGFLLVVATYILLKQVM